MHSVVELIEDTPYMLNLKGKHYYSVLGLIPDHRPFIV